MSTIKVIAAGVAAAITLAAPTGASAENARNRPQETVSFADLDLSNPQHADELMSRIQGAVHRVCADQPGAPPLREVRQCVNVTLEQTLAGLDAQTLAALGHERSTLASNRRMLAAR